MDLRQLQMFVAVAEEGGIRAGARRLMLAQQYVSAGLQKLERELRTELVDRSPRGISLTPAGVALLEQARDILQRLDRTVQIVRDAGEAKRRLSIGLMGGMVAAAELTFPIIRTFQQAHPDVTLDVQELTFDCQVKALASGEIDAALVRLPIVEEAIEVIPLFTEPLELCMSAGHELADAEELEARDILEETMVDLVRSPQGFMSFWHLDALRGGPAPTDPDGAVSATQVQIALMCKSAVLPIAASAWRLSLAHSVLRSVPLRGAAPSQIAVAFRAGERRAEVSAFSACARQVSADLTELVPGAVLAAG